MNVAARAKLVSRMATILIDDAEANKEYIERDSFGLQSTNRGRAVAGLGPLAKTRVISLSKTRKSYQGQRNPYRGGTHARPREHNRIITDREIVCKDGRLYRRRAQVVTVNPGVARITKVVL